MLPEDAAPGIAARWHQAARLLQDVPVQGWDLGVVVILGDFRISPPQGWWAREPPSSGLRGGSLLPRDPSPGVRGPASVVPICLRVSLAVTVWGLGPAQPTRQKVSTQLLPVLLGLSGQGGPQAVRSPRKSSE